jgi:hypothetical protein
MLPGVAIGALDRLAVSKEHQQGKQRTSRRPGEVALTGARNAGSKPLSPIEEVVAATGKAAIDYPLRTFPTSSSLPICPITPKPGLVSARLLQYWIHWEAVGVDP